MPRRRQRKLPFLGGLPRPANFGISGALLATLAMVVLSLWLLAGFVNQVLIGAQQDRRIAAAEDEVAQIQAENNALATAAAYAESPAYAEQIAREQLGYAREGDAVILPSFPQTTPTPLAPTAAPIPSPTPEPNWRGWARAFFRAAPSASP